MKKVKIFWRSLGLALFIFSLFVFSPSAHAQDEICTMVLVKGGTYWQSPELRDGPGPEKQPRQVTVKDFYIGKYEVTFAEYDAFCLFTGRNMPKDNGWSRGLHPVINVSWQDAIDYCNWRSELEGLQRVYAGRGMETSCNFDANGYRLPTEAEWEYAAKGGAESKDFKFSGGNDADAVAWYKGNSKQRTHPVGAKLSNELGLYDMSGNVEEWCWDAYYWRDEYTKPEKSMRACRGGSWRSDVNIACGNINGLDMPSVCVGFRVARTAGEKSATSWMQVSDQHTYIDKDTVIKDGDMIFYWDLYIDPEGYYKRLIQYGVRTDLSPLHAWIIQGFLYDQDDQFNSDIIRAHSLAIQPGSYQEKAFKFALTFVREGKLVYDVPKLPHLSHKK